MLEKILQYQTHKLVSMQFSCGSDCRDLANLMERAEGILSEKNLTLYPDSIYIWSKNCPMYKASVYNSKM